MREKTLMVGFLWVLLLIWVSAVGSRVSNSIMEVKNQNALLTGQEIWISSEADIDLRLKKRKVVYAHVKYLLELYDVIVDVGLCKFRSHS